MNLIRIVPNSVVRYYYAQSSKYHAETYFSLFRSRPIDPTQLMLSSRSPTLLALIYERLTLRFMCHVSFSLTIRWVDPLKDDSWKVSQSTIYWSLSKKITHYSVLRYFYDHCIVNIVLWLIFQFATFVLKGRLLQIEIGLTFFGSI